MVFSEERREQALQLESNDLPLWWSYLIAPQIFGQKFRLSADPKSKFHKRFKYLNSLLVRMILRFAGTAFLKSLKTSLTLLLFEKINHQLSYAAPI